MSTITPEQSAATCHSSRLRQYSLLRITGEGASQFLQGQFGNDLRLVDEQHHQLNCYANPKGRLLAIFRIFLHGPEEYWLRLPSDIADATLKRLKMFVLMAKVVLQDQTEETGGIGVCGVDAQARIAAALSTAEDELPREVNAMRQLGGLDVLCVPSASETPRYELYGACERIEEVAQSLAANGAVIGEDEWMLGEIMAGIPTLYAATCEQFVAQMVNLDRVDGLSFKKGCYPGQEIVARMHYLGNLKRRTYLARIDGEAPAPASEVISAHNASKAGVVLDARTAGPNLCYALLVLTKASVEDGHPLHIGTVDGTAIELLSLPYALSS